MTGPPVVSPTSVWEMAVKPAAGKLRVGTAIGSWATRASRELSAELLDVTPEHAAAVERLPPIHRDPFNRLLVAQANVAWARVAQARVEGAVLLTADRVLAAYGPFVRLVGEEATSPHRREA